MDLREWERWIRKHKNRKPNKERIFSYGKCFEDVRQDEKHVPDLLESIMRPTDLVKEESRPNSFKTTQFDPKTKKIRVCTFQMSEKIPDSANVAFEAVLLTFFLQYLAALAAKYLKKIGF